MATASRLNAILTIGLFAVLSVAVILTVITVSRNNVFSRFSRSHEKEDRKRCPLSAKQLREALANICDTRDDLMLNVSYGGETLKCDQSTTKEKTTTSPSVTLKSAEENAQYTVVMVDPDAPGHSLDDLRLYLHWVNTDLIGLALSNGFKSAHTLMSYAGPTPPPGSGVHRYQFIVFESTAKYGATYLYHDKKKRGHFSLLNFVQKNDLCTIVGLFQFTVTADKN